MGMGTIFDLKDCADRLLSTRSFVCSKDKVAFEYELHQVLQQLVQIKLELACLNQSTNRSLAHVPEYCEEDDELSCLIRKLRNRAKVLPSEPVQSRFHNELSSAAI